MQIEKPIFIIGAQRSGTTWLGSAFEQHLNIACWNEIRHVWIWGNSNKPDDLLAASDLTPQIKSHIEDSFVRYLKKKKKNRICDKTPSNCLRIPFIKAVFPDAKIILIIRDGRSVISSTQKKLHQPTGVPWKEINRRLSNIPMREWHSFLPRLKSRLKTVMGKPLDYWGVQPPGWREWVGKYPSHIVAAKQWAEMLKIAIQEGRKLPPENYLEVYYENLAAAPQDELAKIIDFAQISHPEPIIEYLVSTADPSRTDKWRESIDAQALNDIREIMEPMMIQLGYSW